MKSTVMKYLKSILLFVAMIGSVALADHMKPDTLMSELRPHPKLEDLIPTEFAGWRLDPNTTTLVVDATLQRTLTEIYSETLSRTYVNAQGDRIMLSIAYGANQSRDLQLHRPEVCYSAQGFQVKGISSKPFTLPSSDVIQSKTLVAKNGPRIEPITYWMRVGDKVVTTGIDQMLTRYNYGLRGYIPDGLLVRVSNIDSDEAKSLDLHKKFITQLYESIKPENKTFIFGSSAS